MIGLVAVAAAAFADPPEEARLACESGSPAVAIKTCEPLAKAGNIYAQHALARMLLYATPAYPVEGQQWLRRAAEGGNVKAESELGKLLEVGGAGFERDPAEAAKWYQEAAELGNVDAQLWLGDLYATGRGVAHNDAIALTWYRAAADKRADGAADKYAALYEKVHGEPPPLNDAVTAQVQAAENGDVEKQYQLGRTYASGAAVALNYAEAAKWFREAADNGHVDAQHQLGYLYENGLGVTRDVTEASKWYRLAAEHGDVEAMSIMGRLYWHGQDFAHDKAETVKWFRRAADTGDIYGQRFVADAYAEGFGVEQDFAEAAKWYRLAGDQGSPDAMLKLAALYEAGKGVPVDFAEAAKP